MSPDKMREIIVDPSVEKIMSYLKNLGAKVELGDREAWGIVSTEREGQVQCVDGREPTNSQLARGPKFPGATEGVAYFMAKLDGSDSILPEHVGRAAIKIEELGYKPGVHDMGDDLHCGHAKLVSGGGFPIKMGMQTTQLAEMLESRGGQNPTLAGEHEETVVILNFAEATTRDPNGSNQAFCVDLWFAKKLGLDPIEVASHSAETVQKLNSQAWRKVVIIL